MLILGHRGASKAAPENTLKAFELAYDMQADGIEFDVYQVQDQLLVFHDRWLNRTTNVHGRVAEQTVAYMRSLDAGAGQSIPLLDEVLAITPKGALVNIELKHMHNVHQFTAQLSTLLSRCNISLEQVVVSSFHHGWLKQVRDAFPAIKIGALTASYPVQGIDVDSALSAYSLHIALDIIDREYVKRVQQAGLKVFVYTVDYPQDMVMLRDWGVDAIFTNVPDIARQTLGPSLV